MKDADAVQILVNVQRNMNAVRLFDELNCAIRDVLRRYEREYETDMEMSAYIIDREGNAIY